MTLRSSDVHCLSLPGDDLLKDQDILKPVERGSGLNLDVLINITVLDADNVAGEQTLRVNLVKAGSKHLIPNLYFLIVHDVAQVALVLSIAFQNALGTAALKHTTHAACSIRNQQNLSRMGIDGCNFSYHPFRSDHSQIGGQPGIRAAVDGYAC